MLPSVPGASSLAHWSDHELGRVWQTTFTQLQRHHTAAATEDLAQARAPTSTSCSAATPRSLHDAGLHPETGPVRVELTAAPAVHGG